MVSPFPNERFEMTIEYLRTILKKSNVHWVVKSRLILKYQLENPLMNLNTVATKLQVSIVSLFDYLKLEKFLKKYPQLFQIPSKIEALNLINSTENHEELQSRIKKVAFEYKSQAQLAKITHQFTDRIEDDPFDTFNSKSGESEI